MYSGHLTSFTLCCTSFFLFRLNEIHLAGSFLAGQSFLMWLSSPQCSHTWCNALQYFIVCPYDRHLKHLVTFRNSLILWDFHSIKTLPMLFKALYIGPETSMTQFTKSPILIFCAEFKLYLFIIIILFNT